MNCDKCGIDRAKYEKMKTVVRAADQLIMEGRVEENMDGVVDASDKLIDALDALHNGVDTGGLGAIQ